MADGTGLNRRDAHLEPSSLALIRRGHARKDLMRGLDQGFQMNLSEIITAEKHYLHHRLFSFFAYDPLVQIQIPYGSTSILMIKLFLRPSPFKAALAKSNIFLTEFPFKTIVYRNLSRSLGRTSG